MPYDIPVGTVLRIYETGHEIAVFRVISIIHIIAVDAVAVTEGSDTGNGLYEGFELREERTREVNFLPVGRRIPRITPPTVVAVDGERSLRRVSGNDFFLAQVTWTLIECEFIAESHPPLETTVGAECRSWHLKLFVKCQVSIADRELIFTVLTCSGFIHTTSAL